MVSGPICFKLIKLITPSILLNDSLLRMFLLIGVIIYGVCVQDGGAALEKNVTLRNHRKQ